MSAVIIFVSFIGLFIGSLMACTYAVKRGMRPARAVVMQICSFAILFVTAFAATAMVSSAAEGTPEQETEINIMSSETQKTDKEWDNVAMALAIGLASIGAGLAVAAAAPAAIGAVSEDPKAFGKAIVFVGLAEGVPIFGLLVALIIKFM